MHNSNHGKRCRMRAIELDRANAGENPRSSGAGEAAHDRPRPDQDQIGGARYDGFRARADQRGPHRKPQTEGLRAVGQAAPHIVSDQCGTRLLGLAFRNDPAMLVGVVLLYAYRPCAG
jgi:hypothetical protein